MKSIKILGLFLCAVLYINISIIGLDSVDVIAETPASLTAQSISNIKNAPEHMKMVASDGNLRLYVNDANENKGEFCLINTTTGKQWYSNPQNRLDVTDVNGPAKFEMFSQFILYLYDTTKLAERSENSYVGCNMGEGVTVSLVEHGFKAVYVLQDANITIPIYVTLENQSLRVRTAVNEIKEEGNAAIIRMALMPYFGSGNEKDEGYIFVPDGSGALINFNNKKKNAKAYSQYVYGDDPALSEEMKSSITQQVHFPVFGVKKNEDAFFAVIDNGERNARITAYTSGLRNNQNNVYTEFDIRAKDIILIGQSDLGLTKDSIKYDFDHLMVDECSVSYYFLEQKNADYSGMALFYRDYLQKQGLGKSARKTTDKIVHIELFGGMTKKESYFGLLLDRYKVLTSFEDAAGIIRDFKDQGADNVVVSYRNWSVAEKEGKIQKKVRVMNSLGNLKELQNLKQLTGDSLYLNFDLFRIKSSGNGVSKYFDTSKRLSKEPILMYSYKPSTGYKNTSLPAYYLVKPKKLPSIAQEFYDSLKRSIDCGVSYVNSATMLYTDFNTKDFSSRTNTVNQIQNALKNQHQGALLYRPNSYTLPYASSIFSSSYDCSRFDIEDQRVPFYQMAISGLLDYSLSSFNMSANPSEMVLNSIETGSTLQLTFISSNASAVKGSNFDYLYAADYSKWKNISLQEWKRVVEVYANLGSRVVIHHEKLADGIYKTDYKNGRSVITNYNDEIVKTSYGDVNPKSYILL